MKGASVDCGDCPNALGCYPRCARAIAREHAAAEERGQLTLPLVRKGKQGSKPNRAAGGYATAAKMTAAQRQDRARKGAAARKAKAVKKYGVKP